MPTETATSAPLTYPATPRCDCGMPGKHQGDCEEPDDRPLHLFENGNPRLGDRARR